MLETSGFESEPEKISQVIKTVFYGYTVLAAFSMITGPERFAGAVLTLPVLLSISYVSAEVADMMNDSWSGIMGSVALAGLLIAVVFAPALIVLF